MKSHSQRLVGDLRELGEGRVILFFSGPQRVDPAYSIDCDDQHSEVVCSIGDYLKFLGEGLDLALVVELLDQVGYSSVGCPVHEEESALVGGVLPKMVAAVMRR